MKNKNFFEIKISKRSLPLEQKKISTKPIKFYFKIILPRQLFEIGSIFISKLINLEILSFQEILNLGSIVWLKSCKGKGFVFSNVRNKRYFGQ